MYGETLAIEERQAGAAPAPLFLVLVTHVVERGPVRPRIKCHAGNSLILSHKNIEKIEASPEYAQDKHFPVR